MRSLHIWKCVRNSAGVLRKNAAGEKNREQGKTERDISVITVKNINRDCNHDTNTRKDVTK